MTEIDYEAVYAAANRANPDDIWILLWTAKDKGWIKDWAKHKVKGRLYWEITVRKTRYQNYHNPDGPDPTITLKGREVLAFIEGLWVGLEHEPTTRAGHSYGAAPSTINRRLRQQHAAQEAQDAEWQRQWQRQDEEEEPVEAVDITEQPAIEGTAEEQHE